MKISELYQLVFIFIIPSFAISEIQGEFCIFCISRLYYRPNTERLRAKFRTKDEEEFRIIFYLVRMS